MRKTIVGLIRTVLGLPFFAVATAFWGAWVIPVSRRNPASPRINRTTRTWGRFCLFIGGVTFDAEGAEHVDPDKVYVVVSNHRSNFDIPLHFVALPVPIRFLAKSELYRIPIFGQILRAMGIVEVNREAHASGHRAVNAQVDTAIANRHSLLVYAEGTRARGGERLQPFKKGAFHIAIQHDLDILPVAVSGTEAAWPADSRLITGGHARVVIHPPIPTAGLGPDDVGRLRDHTRAIIEKSLIDLESG